MSLNKTAVFLASRFDEFSELRQLLKRKISDFPVVQLTPIDLNDGNVSHHPPLAQCLGFVRRSEFMVLLIGDSYGSLAPRSNKSFTHLEYEEAIREGSGTRILAFCIGESYIGRRIRYSDHQMLAGWQRQLEENHTLGFFEPGTPVEEMAKEIFDRLLTALYELHLGNLSVAVSGDATDELFDALDDEVSLDDSEVATLDARDAQARGLSLLDDRAQFKDTLQAITQPAAVAALEQREEAHRAIEIGDYGTAVKHLKRAVDIKPLDVMSNYWLSQLYVALGRKELCPSAVELADRASLVAEYDGSMIRAASCKMIAAKASRLQEKGEDAVDYARRAVELAPRYARAQVELARQLTLSGNAAEAVKAIEQAFNLYPRSLKEVLSDPTFRPIRRHIDAIIKEIKDKLLGTVRRLHDCERNLVAIAGGAEPPPQEGMQSISKLTEAGRASTRRQHHLVCKAVSSAMEASKAIDETTQDFSTATQEVFNFSRPGAFRIVEWHVSRGDIIEPDQAVFSFQFEHSGAVRVWLWRRKYRVRLVRLAGDSGVSITPESPYLFSHVSASVEIRPLSQKQQLMMALDRARSQSSAADHTVEQAARQLSAWQSQSMPGAVRIVVGLCFGLYGAWSIYSGGLFLGIVNAVLAAVNLVTGINARTAYKRDGAFHKARHQEAVNAQQDHQLRVVETEQALSALERGVAEVQAKARQAVELFDAVPIRVGARMFPFPSLFGCQKGDVIRCTDAQITDFESRTHRRVERQDDLPEWLIMSEAPGRRVGFHIYRVAEASHQKLVLSRGAAYEAGSLPAPA